jgi:hypothetical protein
MITDHTKMYRIPKTTIEIAGVTFNAVYATEIKRDIDFGYAVTVDCWLCGCLHLSHGWDPEEGNIYFRFRHCSDKYNDDEPQDYAIILDPEHIRVDERPDDERVTNFRKITNDGNGVLRNELGLVVFDPDESRAER